MKRSRKSLIVHNAPLPNERSSDSSYESVIVGDRDMFEFIINIGGAKKSGKSKFIDRLSRNRAFTKEVHRHDVLKKLSVNQEIDGNLDGIDIQFYDVYHENHKLPYFYTRSESNFFLYCVDLSKPINEDQINRDIALFQNNNLMDGPAILVGTKSDIMLPGNLELFNQIIPKNPGSDYKIITSSKNDNGIDKLRAFLIKLAHLNKQSKDSFRDGYLQINSLSSLSTTQYFHKDMRTLRVSIIGDRFDERSQLIDPRLNSSSAGIKKIIINTYATNELYYFSWVIDKTDACFIAMDLSKSINQNTINELIQELDNAKHYDNTVPPTVILIGTNSDAALVNNIHLLNKIALERGYKRKFSKKETIEEAVNDEISWLIKHVQSRFNYTTPENPIYFDFNEKRWKSIDAGTTLYLFKDKINDKAIFDDKGHYKFISMRYIRSISGDIHNDPGIPDDVSHYKLIDMTTLLTHRFNDVFFKNGRLNTKAFFDNTDLNPTTPFKPFIHKRTTLCLIKRKNPLGEYEYFIRQVPMILKSKDLPEGITHYMLINTAYLFTHYHDAFLFPQGNLRQESLSVKDIQQYLHPDDHQLSMERCTGDTYFLVENQRIYLIIKPKGDESNAYYFRVISGEINNAHDLPDGVNHYMAIEPRLLMNQRQNERFFPNGYLNKEPFFRNEVLKCLIADDHKAILKPFNTKELNEASTPLELRFSELDPPRLPGDQYFPSLTEGFIAYPKKSYQFFPDKPVAKPEETLSNDHNQHLANQPS